MTASVDALVAELASTWPKAFRTPVAPADRKAQSALNAMAEVLRQGAIGSLPYFLSTNDSISWITLGGRNADLRHYADDLRSWIFPYHGPADSLTLVADAGSGRLGQRIADVTPEGYLRWTTPSSNARAVLEVLSTMHTYIASAPAMQQGSASSLSSLRLQFSMALRIGDWSAAASAVEEIDRRQLDQAHRTMQMRIRLLDAQGAIAELLAYVVKQEAWIFSNPRRIVAAILRAVYEVGIEPLEVAGHFQAALNLFKVEWYPRLAPLLEHAEEARHLKAYAAVVDRDYAKVESLFPSISQGAAAYLRSLVPIPSFVANAPIVPEAAVSDPLLDVAPPSPAPLEVRNGASFWTSLHAAVRDGRQERARSLLEEVDSALLSDIEFLSAAPDALLELLSDDAIEARTASRILRHEVLSLIIDVIVGSSRFPSLQHVEIYLGLADGLTYLRGASANEADAQLLLGLISGAVFLDPKYADRCSAIIREWWAQRAIVTRIPWLIAALDTVALLHPDPTTLQTLWADGLILAERKQYRLTPSELKTWRRVGAAIEYSATDAATFLDPVAPDTIHEAIDILAQAGLERIAIVSLQETGAREAAAELSSRTNAEVILVNGLVQGGQTRRAAEADLILFVWAASSHAVYRAFDDCRDRLVYVQGTGAASIVSAAEKWASLRE
ncbi:MAG: hypothetical protein QE284_20275 [Rhizobium sp.]|nr:hypothetical protein [Rhizobium sp.]